MSSDDLARSRLRFTEFPHKSSHFEIRGAMLAARQTRGCASDHTIPSLPRSSRRSGACDHTPPQSQTRAAQPYAYPPRKSENRNPVLSLSLTRGLCPKRRHGFLYDTLANANVWLYLSDLRTQQNLSSSLSPRLYTRRPQVYMMTHWPKRSLNSI